jgi:putative spermidine/putrescine transport system permease protein
MAVVKLQTPRPGLTFSLLVSGLFGILFGYVGGVSFDRAWIGVLAGIAIAMVFAVLAAGPFAEKRTVGRWVMVAICAAIGLAVGGLPAAIAGALVGAVMGWLAFWLTSGQYRAGVPTYATPGQVLWHNAFLLICGLIFFFLIAPIVIVMPLSFNAQMFFTFTPEMLSLDPAGYSLRHYRDFFSNSDWQQAMRNSLMIAPMATFISVSLGTLAAIGLSQSHVPFRRAIMAILISPMIVPLIISAAGMYFFYSRVGLQGTYWGIVLAHAALGIPFVIITVTATLVGFDRSLTRAAANMGADPVTTFFRVQMPLILPGVISGALFAFITSFDEVVVVLFVGSAGQKTLPWQMFIGLREQISPTILAVATLLVFISIALLTTLELLRRRSERLRGMSPG